MLKMKKNILSAIFIGFSLIGISQQDISSFYLKNRNIINDATLVEQALETKYPGFNQVWDNQYQLLLNKSKHTNSRSTLNIPVVVHVVWKNNIENLSDSIVNAQIDILNKCFQRQNSDTGNLRSVFNPIAGNPNIQFSLVNIVRVNTSTNFNIDFF